MLCDASQHPGTNLFTIVKGKHIVGKSGAAKRSVRTRLTFDFPAEPEQGRKLALLWPRATGSCSNRDGNINCDRPAFAMLKTLGDNTKRERFGSGHSFLSVITISQDARQLWHFS